MNFQSDDMAKIANAPRIFSNWSSAPSAAGSKFTSAPPQGWARPIKCSRKPMHYKSEAWTWYWRFIEPHDRLDTAALIEGLEVVPRQPGRVQAA